MSVFEKINQMYSQYPEAKKKLEIGYPNTDKSFNKIRQNPPLDLSLKSIESYSNGDDLAFLLGQFPAEVIYKSFGNDILIWIWMNNIYCKKDYLSGTETINGNNPELMEKARLIVWQHMQPNYNVETVKAVYELNQNIFNGIANSIDLDTILRNNVKDNIQLSDKRLKDYSFVPLMIDGDCFIGHDINWGKKWNNKDRYFSMYLDAPMGLALAYKNEPNAMIGICPNDKDTIMIYQIQGVRGEKIVKNKREKIPSRGLVPINWQNILVDVVSEIGCKLNFTKIGIQSGRNNTWTNPNNGMGGAHLPMEKALNIYDEFAKKIGFEQGKNGNWYKSIK